MTYKWKEISAPGSIRYRSNFNLQFKAKGTYVLELTVSDGKDDVSTKMTIEAK